MIHFKPGVILHATETTNAIMDAIERVYGSHGYNWVITSGRDGQHRTDSKHYTDEALDARTRHVKQTDLDPIIWGLRQQLGPSYDVVLEADHVHIEYDPHELPER